MEQSNYSVGQHGLKKLTPRREPEISAAARTFGHIVSYIFHPLFIPTYVTCFLLFIHPLVFAGYSDRMKIYRLINVVFCTFFIPAFAVFVMWRLKLVITSLQMKTQQERIIPLVISMTFTFWSWYVFKNVDSPAEIQIFLLGAFLSICGAWLLNIPIRVSLHATAMGSALTFFFILAFRDSTFNGVYLSVAIFIAGLVCTARFMVSHHTAYEIYLGFFAGVVCQLVALYFV